MKLSIRNIFKTYNRVNGINNLQLAPSDIDIWMSDLRLSDIGLLDWLRPSTDILLNVHRANEGKLFWPAFYLLHLSLPDLRSIPAFKHFNFSIFNLYLIDKFALLLHSCSLKCLVVDIPDWCDLPWRTLLNIIFKSFNRY